MEKQFKVITPEQFIRINNDFNGNPRYYISYYEVINDRFTEELSNKHIKLLRDIGLYKYRGKEYGKGYVIQSYNLQDKCKYLNSKLK